MPLYRLRRVEKRVLIGDDFNALRLEALFIFRSNQNIGCGQGWHSAVHGGNYIGAIEPMRLSQVSGGIVRGVVGVRVVKANDSFAPAASQLKRGNYLFRIDTVTVGGGVDPHVLASQGHGDPAMPAGYVTQQNSTALMGITTFGFPSDQIVV